MIRIAVFSRSDALHREIFAAAGGHADLTVELRLRSLPELRGGDGIDVFVVEPQGRGELESIVGRIAPVPVVCLAQTDLATGPLRDSCDGWADLADLDADRIVAAARAAALGFVVREHEIDALYAGGDDDQRASATSPRGGLGPTGGAGRRGAPADGTDPPVVTPVSLTPREREVLELLVRGNTNAAIAEALGVSANTVKYHLAGLYGKLDAGTRSEAIWQAARGGIISM